MLKHGCDQVTCRVPQAKRNNIVADFDVCRVIVKHRRQVSARKAVRCVRKKQASLQFERNTSYNKVSIVHRKISTKNLIERKPNNTQLTLPTAPSPTTTNFTVLM
jgi:uncharacterized protein YlxW (UPF0749 family)